MNEPMEDVINNIVQYERDSQRAENDRMDVDLDVQSSRLEAELDHLIEKFSLNIQNQQQTLERIMQETAVTDFAVVTTPSSDPIQRLRQVLAMIGAYTELTESPPMLPDHLSLVPKLQALQDLNQALKYDREYVESAMDTLESLEKQAVEEDDRLIESKILADAISVRYDNLLQTQNEQSAKTLEQLANESLEKRKNKRLRLNDEMSRIQEVLDNFIRDQLAVMIAAEEMGGPVTGELAEINEQILQAGFSNQGKPKDSKSRNVEVSNSKRQQRIDEIWGNNSNNTASERQAAYKEMTELIDKLIRTLEGVTNLGSYVQLERDSAASRFLVRSKVAQFHPRDAQRIRLIDFGREINT